MFNCFKYFKKVLFVFTAFIIGVTFFAFLAHDNRSYAQFSGDTSKPGTYCAGLKNEMIAQNQTGIQAPYTGTVDGETISIQVICLQCLNASQDQTYKAKCSDILGSLANCVKNAGNDLAKNICYETGVPLIQQIINSAPIDSGVSTQGSDSCRKEEPENIAPCQNCINQGGVWTAIGCVQTTPIGLITNLIRIAFGVMGGVAVLQLMIVGVMYQSGDEQKIAEARSKLIATISGVAVLVFSVLILQIIGVNVLDVVPEGLFI